MPRQTVHPEADHRIVHPEEARQTARPEAHRIGLLREAERRTQEPAELRIGLREAARRIVRLEVPRQTHHRGADLPEAETLRAGANPPQGPGREVQLRPSYQTRPYLPNPGLARKTELLQAADIPAAREAQAWDRDLRWVRGLREALRQPYRPDPDHLRIPASARGPSASAEQRVGRERPRQNLPSAAAVEQAMGPMVVQPAPSAVADSSTSSP